MDSYSYAPSYQGGSNVTKTIKYDTEAPLSCVATNKDATQIVVAGRNIVQVFGVDHYPRPTKFKCKAKITTGGRPQKSALQYNSSISDVSWSSSDVNRLATASTNGSITIWNIEKLAEQITLAAHTRSAHKVSFCSDDPNLVLSASQDSTVKFFDIREHHSSYNPTVARQLQMPKGRASPVRDVQYCPYSCYHLAVANENGELQLWDVRNTSRYLQSLTCHFGSIMCIDWNPNRTEDDGVGILATAGCRDHLVKVWEVPIGLRDPLHNLCSIKTSNVNRICWRKEDYQLASSSNLNIDLSIHIWDIKRPYIPYASFEGHTELVTGIRWSNDRDAFFSVGKDGLVIRHSFNDADHLVNSLTPIATDISPDGSVSIVSRQNTTAPSVGPEPFMNTQLQTFQKFQLKTSDFKTIPERSATSDTATFVKLAKKYKLKEDSISNLCMYNSNIAAQEGELYTANLWLMINYLYSNCDNSNDNDSDINSNTSSTNKRKEFAHFSSSHHKLQDFEKGMTSDSMGRPIVTDSDTNREKSKHEISTGNSEDHSDSQQEDLVQPHHQVSVNQTVPTNPPCSSVFIPDARYSLANIAQRVLFGDQSQNLPADSSGKNNESLSVADDDDEEEEDEFDDKYDVFKHSYLNIDPDIEKTLANIYGPSFETHRRSSIITDNPNVPSSFLNPATSSSSTLVDKPRSSFPEGPDGNELRKSTGTNNDEDGDMDSYDFSVQQPLQDDTSGHHEKSRLTSEKQYYLVPDNPPNASSNPETRCFTLKQYDCQPNNPSSNAPRQRYFVLESGSQDCSNNLSVDQRTNSESRLTNADSTLVKDKNETANSESSSKKKGPLDMQSCEAAFEKMIFPSISHHRRHTSEHLGVASMFQFFQDLVDQNCLQLVCSAIIILESKYKFVPRSNYSDIGPGSLYSGSYNNNVQTVPLSQVQESLLESWFQSYIDLLVDYQLWTISCLITKLCPCPQINANSQQSTTITTRCGKCSRILVNNTSSAMPQSHRPPVSSPTSTTTSFNNLVSSGSSTNVASSPATTNLASPPNTSTANTTTSATTNNNSTAGNLLIGGAGVCVRHPTNQQTISCAVCKKRVNGDYVWCNVCQHGGHIYHFSKWFEKTFMCPSSCGHKCIFN